MFAVYIYEHVCITLTLVLEENNFDTGTAQCSEGTFLFRYPHIFR